MLLHVGEVGGVGFIVGELGLMWVVIIAGMIVIVIVISPGFAGVHGRYEGDGESGRAGEWW